MKIKLLFTPKQSLVGYRTGLKKGGIYTTEDPPKYSSEKENENCVYVRAVRSNPKSLEAKLNLIKFFENEYEIVEE